MTVTTTPTRIVTKGAQKATIRNEGESTIYFARTSAGATPTTGFPLYPGEGLWMDGPLYAATATGTGELRVLPPA